MMELLWNSNQHKIHVNTRNVAHLSLIFVRRIHCTVLIATIPYNMLGVRRGCLLASIGTQEPSRYGRMSHPRSMGVLVFWLSGWALLKFKFSGHLSFWICTLCFLSVDTNTRFGYRWLLVLTSLNSVTFCNRHVKLINDRFVFSFSSNSTILLQDWASSLGSTFNKADGASNLRGASLDIVHCWCALFTRLSRSRTRSYLICATLVVESHDFPFGTLIDITMTRMIFYFLKSLSALHYCKEIVSLN